MDGGLPMAYAISMGVRRTDAARLAQLNDFIRRRQLDIDRILDEYHLPRVHASEGSR
jgi:mxaJ protein